jgi:hypothetical protein
MAAVIEAHDAHPTGIEVLPMLLAQACVKVLGVAGAGLSLTDELRVPLGASDDVAARAEALQTTLGEGPCLNTTYTSEPLVADAATMAARWPMFHRELVAQTPFRTVASIPLRSVNLRRLGALDLYSTSPDSVAPVPMAVVATDIADPIAAILFDRTETALQSELTPPVWLNNRSVADRMNVWIAVGLLIEQAKLSNADAIAALQAYAYGHDATLDEVAELLTSRRLPPDAVLA